MSEKIWAIIGGGNGGQTFAGHLAILGKKVRLYTSTPSKAEKISETNIIELTGSIEGKGKLEFATSDISKAVKGADVIVIVLPSNWHKSISEKIIPLLEDGQTVLILPEASCGALAFKKLMNDMGCTAKIVLGAGCSLPYATRAVADGVCNVPGVKEEVKIAALPATDNVKLEKTVCNDFPCFRICSSVLETSIDNINAMMHPAPVLLNISRIEAEPKQSYEYYREGITPSIGKLLEGMDAERMAVASSLGFEQRSLKRTYIDMYKCGDDSMELWQLIQNNKGYTGIMNVKSLEERYVTEDIPYSLVAISALGKVAGVPTSTIDAVITLGRAILLNKLDEGRTIEALGIASMTKEEFLNYVLGE